MVFTDGTYDDLYETTAPYFLGDYGAADGAAAAIQDVLNAEETTPRLDTVHSSELLSVPYTRENPTSPLEMKAARTGYNSDDDEWVRYGDITVPRDTVWNSHALFTRVGPVGGTYLSAYIAAVWPRHPRQSLGTLWLAQATAVTLLLNLRSPATCWAFFVRGDFLGFFYISF